MIWENQILPGQVYPGEDLVVAGLIGQQGTKALVLSQEKKLSRWFSRDYLWQVVHYECPSVTDCLEEAGKLGATAEEFVGEGGILKALWDLSGAYQVGISFSLRQIPIWQAAVEVCERCGCTPYRLWCGNCVLFSAENGGHLVRFFREKGIAAEVVGIVKKGITREIDHGREKGYLERPREDELFRILGREKVNDLKRSGIIKEYGLDWRQG